MEKEYVFEFPGTKEDFMENLKSFRHYISFTDEEFYYFEDYIVKIVNGKLHFGVQRGGSHSGGYWFIPAVTEQDHRMEFRGTVQYIGPEDRRGKIRKVIDGIGYFFGFILFFPILLLVWCCSLVQWIVRKVRKMPKEKTTQDRLFDLMENHLGCVCK